MSKTSLVELFVEDNEESLSVDELLDFLFDFRVAYAACVHTSNNHLSETSITSEDVENLALQTQLTYSASDLSEILELANVELGGNALRFRSISKNSPLSAVIDCLPIAALAAAVIAGGEFEFNPLTGIFRVKLKSLGQAIQELRSALSYKPDQNRSKRIRRKP